MRKAQGAVPGTVVFFLKKTPSFFSKNTQLAPWESPSSSQGETGCGQGCQDQNYSPGGYMLDINIYVYTVNPVSLGTFMQIGRHTPYMLW